MQRGDQAAAWEVAMRYEHHVWPRFFGFRVGSDGFAHAMLEACGVAPRWRRSPAGNATDEEVEQVRELLSGLGLL